MEYFSHLNDKVVINGETFNLDHFKKIEPNYTLPEGAIGVVYKPNQRRYYIMNDNYQMNESINWVDGDRYISRIQDLKILKEDDRIENELRKKDAKSLKSVSQKQEHEKLAKRDLEEYFKNEKNIQT